MGQYTKPGERLIHGIGGTPNEVVATINEALRILRTKVNEQGLGQFMMNSVLARDCRLGSSSGMVQTYLRESGYIKFIHREPGKPSTWWVDTKRQYTTRALVTARHNLQMKGSKSTAASLSEEEYRRQRTYAKDAKGQPVSSRLRDDEVGPVVVYKTGLDGSRVPVEQTEPVQTNLDEVRLVPELVTDPTPLDRAIMDNPPEDGDGMYGRLVKVVEYLERQINNLTSQLETSRQEATTALEMAEKAEEQLKGRDAELAALRERFQRLRASDPSRKAATDLINRYEPVISEMNGDDS